MLWNITEPLLFVLAVLAFFVVLELGFRLGRRHRDPDDELARPHVTALQTALLGLLSLLLGFNFAMAASRFDTRKTLIQEEVGAINRTYLRADLLPSPPQEEVKKLLRSYLDSRIEFLRAGTDEVQLEKANLDGSRITAELWTLTSEMMAKNPGNASYNLFVTSLNDTIDINQKRRTALDNHVPEVVIHLLFIVACGALGFIGYGYGLGGKRRHGTTAIFALLIALVLTTILDLDQPRTGLIRVSEDSVLRLKATLDQEAK